MVSLHWEKVIKRTVDLEYVEKEVEPKGKTDSFQIICFSNEEAKTQNNTFINLNANLTLSKPNIDHVSKDLEISHFNTVLKQGGAVFCAEGEHFHFL